MTTVWFKSNIIKQRKRSTTALIRNLASLLLLILHFEPCDSNVSSVKPLSAYKWKVGPWGSCHSATKCGEGQQERSVWCAHLDDRTSLTVLCDAAGRIPDSVRDCFQVCDEHRGKLTWRVGSWGLCLPSTHVGVSEPVRFSSRHHKGFMSREVICVYRRSNHSQARQVNEEACAYFEKKPDQRLSCTVPRPQDCVVTEFGEWLPCRGCGTNRTRTRRVLIAPSHGGQPCPRLFETEPCNEAVGCLQSPNRVREYRLHIGSWSDCFGLDVPGDDATSQYGFWPSVGYQTREITCKDENGVPVEISHCLGDEDPQVPAKVKACVVPVDCIVSSWTDWQVMKEGCVTENGEVHKEVRKRTRQVLRVPLGSGALCPNLEETHVIVNKRLMLPCTRYKWSPTEWTDCVLTEELNVQKVSCGGGIRRRNLTCLRSEDLVPVDMSLCVETPPSIVQRCSVPCKQDCVVSSWSPWGRCKPQDCKSALNRKPVGHQERFRKILVSPSAGGADCPPLQQVDSCDDPTCYVWQTTDFSPCLVLNKELKCGQGKQTRRVNCVDLNGDLVSDALCKMYIVKPEQTVPCYIPCSNDCVLSPWSEWSPCSRICSEKYDVGRRTRNRTILAPSGFGGTPCPSSMELAETEECNKHSCVGFGWKTMPWKPCKVLNPFELCGTGVKFRDVVCVKDDDRNVSHHKCFPLPKPIDRQNCTVPCPKDCVLSKFSDWTLCRNPCMQGETEDMQERVRFILQWPEPGRPLCPTSLKERRTCYFNCAGHAACSQSCETFRWALQDWGLCVLPDNAECGMGYRTRGLSCLRNDREEVDIGSCLQYNRSIPITVQRCHVDCNYFCVFSDWSDWSSCPLSCTGSQTRTRLLLDEGHQMDECRSIQHFPLVESRSCPCIVHSALSEGERSDCILDDNDELTPVNGQEVQGRCGVGQRLKRVACYDKNNQLMDPFLCTKTGYEPDVCMIPCPIDCGMSSWSDWSACSVFCGQGVQHRTRRIQRAEFEGGRPCPLTDATKTQRETRLCSVSCHRFRWIAHEWSSCEINRRDVLGHSCGTGHQSRKVKCVKVIENNRLEAVGENFCDPVLKPPTINFCHIPCPPDCVVSDWSEWSGCYQPCDQSQVRIRRRYVERKPVVMGHACPLLEERDLCSLNNNCFHYSWNVTEWSVCTIPDGAKCGEGIKQRVVVCQRSDGRPMDYAMCEKANASQPENLKVPCMIDCPIDCEVSEWSAWKNDDCTVCGSSSGMFVRTRRTIVHPSPSGRPCPGQLIQKKPCPALPCYQWQHGPWSWCELEGGQCGHGRRRREVLCKRTDGTSVDRLYCLKANHSNLLPMLYNLQWLENVLDIHEEESCFLPCPGDCVMSEWSEWSPCHRDCDGGEQTGVQTRSRAVEMHPLPYGEPCSRHLWETKPCLGGPCLFFSWQVKGSSDVICVRSDGLVVLGGCYGKPRPCVPLCRIIHTECNNIGECVCQNGYRAVYRDNVKSTHRQLLKCELLDFTNSSHRTGTMADSEDVQVVYFANESEISFWVYAMITVGSAFIIFVCVTIYLMRHPSLIQGSQGNASGVSFQRDSMSTIQRNVSKEGVKQ